MLSIKVSPRAVCFAASIRDHALQSLL